MDSFKETFMLFRKALFLVLLAFIYLNLVGATRVKAFPQLPDTAQVISFEAGRCETFMVTIVIYTYNPSIFNGEIDRIEYYISETLFAVQLFVDNEAKAVYILRPDKSIHRYNSIEELKEGPCEIAERLLPTN
ncbi:MAG: hypothetical protein ACRD5H_01890 [Nitrososphaerales archaeon]